MKPIKNYSNTVSVNKLGIPDLPTPSASDSGKILGVDQDGKYALGDDQGTVLPSPTEEDNGKVIVVDNAAYALGNADSVEANPEGSAAERLYKIGINDTIYRVNDDETVTTVKAVKITFDTIQGTDGNVVFQAPFTFVNGTTHEVYQYSVNDTIEASNGGNFDYMIDNASSWGYTVPVANLPLSFIIHIPAGIDITQYNEIYFVSGVYTNPSPKHVTVDVSVNDDSDFINVIDNSDVGYTYHTAIKIGEFANAPTAVLPTVTTSDNGDVLTVVNGVWDKAEPASELPAVTTADNGKVLKVFAGNWTKAKIIDDLIKDSNTTYSSTKIDSTYADKSKLDEYANGYQSYIDIDSTTGTATLTQAGSGGSTSGLGKPFLMSLLTSGNELPYSILFNIPQYLNGVSLHHSSKLVTNRFTCLTSPSSSSKPIIIVIFNDETGADIKLKGELNSSNAIVFTKIT